MNIIDVEQVFENPINGKKLSTPIIEIPDYPITEVFQKYGYEEFKQQASFDQQLYFCPETNHAFLGSHLPQDFIYGGGQYNTKSASSQGSMIAINNFYEFVCKNISGSFDSIVDIGANDATLLRMFRETGARLTGIDPNMKSNDVDINAINDYIENVNLKEILSHSGKNIILCSHTLEHIYDANVFFKIISENTTFGDELFFQFPSLELLIEDSRFDQIHHQHINYYSLHSISILLAKYGFEVSDYYFDSDHYGALMIFFKKAEKIKIREKDANFFSEADILLRYENFLSDMKVTNNRLRDLQGNFYCFGASLMLPILSYYLPEMCNSKGIIDDDNSKHGLSFVNFDCPIIGRDKINFETENFLITALATKSATRKVFSVLSGLKAKNIILPLTGV